METADGSRPATRDDLARVESKLTAEIAKLDAQFDGIAVELARIQADLREITASMADKDGISRVLAAIDALAKRIMDNRRTLLVYDDILGKHETRVVQ
jgi:hypothetical protein